MALQFCVVCGRGSTRPVWNNTIGSFVACDFHDQVQISYAVANATTPGPSIDVVSSATDTSPQT